MARSHQTRREPGRSLATRVRFGGLQTPDGYLFELTGGHLCLDLANTLDERRTSQPRELLASYEDVLNWGMQAGAIEEEAGWKLRTLAAREPAAAQSALQRIVRAREAIFAIFSAVAAQRQPPNDALALLNRVHVKALGKRRLEQHETRFVWAWSHNEVADLDSVLWPVALSAGELLTSAELVHVRVCAGTNCAWLFIDRSKSHTRRWCDMSVCGNRSKVARHRSRSNTRARTD